MNVLIIGSGGREHALAWKLAQSAGVTKVFCAPGNAGTDLIGENVPIQATEFAALADFARSHDVGITVVGPDDALAGGIVDHFQATGLHIFGPTAAAARLESSKAFAKDFMRRHGIPTAAAAEFDHLEAALAHVRAAEYPLVVKADGLALGKGVIIAQTCDDAEKAVRDCMESAVFGEAGRRVVIEEFLTGVECSIHALVDGRTALVFPDCRDHKRVGDGDTGPNTGGMGTVSPGGTINESLAARIRSEIIDRFLTGLAVDGIDFQGMLFPGLMLTKDGPKVLEFNCRWGDPETQVLVRRLKSDLLPLLLATVERRLGDESPVWSAEAATCVILASGGYPGPIKKGLPISGLEKADAHPGAVVFHAGTARSGLEIVTSGGRVLGVTAVGQDLSDARKAAYAAADCIDFEGMQRRNDIGILRV